MEQGARIERMELTTVALYPDTLVEITEMVAVCGYGWNMGNDTHKATSSPLLTRRKPIKGGYLWATDSMVFTTKAGWLYPMRGDYRASSSGLFSFSASFFLWPAAICIHHQASFHPHFRASPILFFFVYIFFPFQVSSSFFSETSQWSRTYHITPTAWAV